MAKARPTLLLQQVHYTSVLNLDTNYLYLYTSSKPLCRAIFGTDKPDASAATENAEVALSELEWPSAEADAVV